MQKSLTADLVIYCIFFIRLSFLIVCCIYYPNELTSWVFNKWWLAVMARSILCSRKIQSSVNELAMENSHMHDWYLPLCNGLITYDVKKMWQYIVFVCNLFSKWFNQNFCLIFYTLVMWKNRIIVLPHWHENEDWNIFGKMAFPHFWTHNQDSNKRRNYFKWLEKLK